jgi:NADH:ubiquinone oxidoreductase subunit 5 (subunit L)/multisubunit Na+/H+ antiporter MnhA subunit
MALIQHDMKRLLGYHAVSQVGYMVLGIGSATAVGVAGGIFHMLNNSIYKQALFMAAGNLEKNAGTTDLDKLGGKALALPFTYISCLIASLSICGIPPFNGFVSKWMIYQGLISAYRVSSIEYRVSAIIALAAAMFGSGLTLASFMKLLHAAFLGQPHDSRHKAQEVDWKMWAPPAILAGLCVIFGVFAKQIPLRYFILPAVGGADFIGTWYSGLATALIIAGLAIGLLIFKLKSLKPQFRQDSSFTGAETADLPATRLSGTEFYNTVKELGVLKYIYKKAEAGVFDIYEQGKSLVFGIGKFFQFLHNGVLPTYLVWMLLGMVGLFLVLMKK